jgi:hypothetical protein
LAAITPQIAQDVKILADGSIDVSEGVRQVTLAVQEEIKAIEAAAGATMQKAITEE